MKARNLVSVLILMMAAGALAAAQSEAPPETPQDTVMAAGVSRSFRVHVPATYNPQAKVPLLLVFASLNEDGAYAANLSGMNAVADQSNFIVVYPDPETTGWDLGFRRNNSGGGGQQPMRRGGGGYGRRGGGGYPRNGGGGGYPQQPEGDAAATRPDDVALVDALLNRLQQNYAVHAARTYAVGMGDGGLMAMRLGCQRSERFAAVATVGATVPKTLGETCLPARPVPLLMFVGTKDPLVPYDGGTSKLGYSVMSAQATVKLWAGLANCPAKPRETKRTAGGAKIGEVVYDDCAQGTAVRMEAVDGMGNTWPGSQQFQPEARFGKSSPAPDASNEIWRFLAPFAVRADASGSRPGPAPTR